MKKKQNIMILHPLSELFNYIRGKKTPGERYALERQMQEDPFLADAVEGLLPLEEHNTDKIISVINTRIYRMRRQSGKRRLMAGIAGILALLIFAAMTYMLVQWVEHSRKESSKSGSELKTLPHAAPATDIVDSSPTSATSTFIAAMPVGGYDAFEDYLNRNAILSERAPVSRLTVKIRFEIDAGGRPVKFVKIKSPGEGYYQSAKKVIVEGPKWIPASDNNVYISTPVELSITFHKMQ